MLRWLGLELLLLPLPPRRIPRREPFPYGKGSDLLPSLAPLGVPADSGDALGGNFEKGFGGRVFDLELDRDLGRGFSDRDRDRDRDRDDSDDDDDADADDDDDDDDVGVEERCWDEDLAPPERLRPKEAVEAAPGSTAACGGRSTRT